MPSLAAKAFSGILWMISSSAGLQAVSFLINVVLARLLVPSDFGAVAIVLGITGILQTFAELGTSVALVQRKTINASVIDSAFISTLIVTVFIVLSLWFTSGYLADYFQLSALEGMIKIASLAYFFRGMFAIYRCLLLRDLRYKEISLISFCGYIVYGTVSVECANKGYGPFSMVWGQLAWTISLLMLGIWRTRYLPRSIGKVCYAKELLAFGIWVSGGRVLRNSAGKLDNFIIGKLIGAAPLGIYTIAQRIVMVFPMLLSSIIDQVMLPIYSLWQDDLPQLEKAYWQVLSYSTVLMIIPVFLVIILAESLIVTIFGHKWIAAVPLVKIISLYGLARVLGDGITDSVIFAVGKPEVITIINIFRIIVMPVCLIAGTKYGITGVAWGLAVFAFVGRLFNQWLLSKKVGFLFCRYFMEIFAPLFYAVTGYIVVTYMIRDILSSADISASTTNIVSAILWLLIYLVFTRIFSHKKWAFLMELFGTNIAARMRAFIPL